MLCLSVNAQFQTGLAEDSTEAFNTKSSLGTKLQAHVSALNQILWLFVLLKTQIPYPKISIAALKNQDFSFRLT